MLMGFSRQNYYKTVTANRSKYFRNGFIVSAVGMLRQVYRQSWGVVKTHGVLTGLLARFGIKIGRDRLAGLMRDSGGMLVRTKRRPKHYTVLTSPENLLEGSGPSEPGIAWAADTTYLRTENGQVKLSLVIDLGSRYVVGWHLATKDPSKQALANALNQYPCPKIHHSDRGIEYINTGYTGMLKQMGIHISLSKKASPHENARIERLNGILKHELGLNKKLKDVMEMYQKVKTAINNYNYNRPHLSLKLKTPANIYLAT
ncbi:MAG: hypothetical protein Kapaf2KO_18580 [Candidatus Kapaibacteriales bacterium]